MREGQTSELHARWISNAGALGEPHLVTQRHGSLSPFAAAAHNGGVRFVLTDYEGLREWLVLKDVTAPSPDRRSGLECRHMGHGT